MADHFVTWLGGFCTGFAMAGWLFSRIRRDRDPDWRRSFSHENTNRPSKPTPFNLRRRNPFVSDFQQQINDSLGLTESPIQRSNAGNNPATPKPEIVPRGQRVNGYQPRQSGTNANPPPTNP
jgi:hypothetical protein